MHSKIYLQVLVVAIAFFTSLVFGAPGEIEFAIESSEKRVNFAVPEEMIPTNISPPKESVSSALLVLDPKALGGKGEYYVNLVPFRSPELLENMQKKNLVESIEQGSIYSGYRMYQRYDNPVFGFILVGSTSGGRQVFLKCAAKINPYTKCTYYGAISGVISYELIFPESQIATLDKLVELAVLKINKIMRKD
ncbi:MAG: hypothetical protein A3I66_17110 [Burkholderiales bacterium RIFCSPLOWO2_02_FULL_57_36]|nr:MAG: hypothetical protein A3I66_17110 [Burkholderiales bacterium RIFCSPLOWO2_02_FULL_57_36]